MTKQLDGPHLPSNWLTKTGSALDRTSEAVGRTRIWIGKLAREALIKAKENKKFLGSLAFLCVLVFTPWISEAALNRQLYSDLKRYSEPVDPLKMGEFAQDINKYTPGVNEKSEDVAATMMTKDDSYTLAQQLSVNSNKNVGGPDRQPATYTVQKGESVTQIAERFNLHVGSLLEANDLKAEDLKKIQAGTVLNIPSSDTSTSTDWLVAINKAEEEAKKAAEQARQAELKKQQLAAAKKKGRVLAAATTSSSSSAYEGVDRSGLIVPISSKGISQGFGHGHTGIDYMADIGTAVHAAAGGKVIMTSGGWSGGYGNQVLIDHGGGRVTRYAHLSSFAVGAGDVVGQGQTIGYSGSTGRSSGPHLHFELIIGGSPVPPF